MTSRVTPLLAAAGDHVLVGRDFNCVLRDQDTTGTTPRSQATAERRVDFPARRAKPHVLSGGHVGAPGQVLLSRARADKLLQAETAAVPFSAGHHAFSVKLQHSGGMTRTSKTHGKPKAS